MWWRCTLTGNCRRCTFLFDKSQKEKRRRSCSLRKPRLACPVCHPSPASFARRRLMSHRFHPCHAVACVRTRSRELMKLQLHPGLSNGRNNTESPGALRMSGRLQPACGQDGQILGSDTHTLTHTFDTCNEPLTLGSGV